MKLSRSLRCWWPVGPAIAYASITPYIFMDLTWAAVSGIAGLIAAFCYGGFHEIMEGF